jgi:hypothetical protein
MLYALMAYAQPFVIMLTTLLLPRLMSPMLYKPRLALRCHGVLFNIPTLTSEQLS